MYSHETLVLLLSTVSRCEGVLAWPAVPDVETQWCTNDTWVKRASSKKITCGTWSSLFSLPVKELEYNKIGSTGREIGELFKSGSTGI